MSESRPRSILIVEDEGIVARDLQQTLMELGYDAFAIAASAEEALARASERCPDIVLMDIRIKGARDGIQTAEILKERFGVPVVFLSAHADEATLERAKKTEPHGYLLKPVKSAELRSAIEVALYRHEKDKRLLARERMLSGTLGAISDAVLVVDLAGNVAFMNSAAETLTGTSAEQALGQSLHEVLQPALSRLQGERTPIVDRDRTVGVTMVFRDVSEQQNKDQRKRLSERLASLASMAAGVAHQVNSPLAAVIANSTFASDELRQCRGELGHNQGPVEARLDEIALALVDVHAAAEHIRAITSSLRTFAGQAQEPQGVADLVRASQQAVRSTSHELARQTSLFTHFEATPLVKADQSKIVQVIESLLLNALQAATAEGTAEHRVNLTTSTDELGRALIEVQDSGGGIPAELQQQIFEPFFTTKPGATGLGLSISQGIVTALGGELELESQPGHGATFRVHLPAATSAEQRALGTATQAAVRAKILVIDDEPLVLRAIERILREHELVCTTSATHGLALIEQQQAFDVVLSDLIMPGMSGIALYEALLRENPELARRVVFISGGSLSQEEEDFLQSIGNRRLSKPFDVGTLLELVQELMAERSKP